MGMTKKKVVHGNRFKIRVPSGKDVSGMKAAAMMIVLAVCMRSPEIVSASGEYSARSLAVAGSYSTLARGWEVCGWNPANLAAPDAPTASLGIIAIGATVGNSSFSISDFNRYNGKYLAEKEKEEILSKIPDDGLKIDTRAEGSALGFTVRNYAFTVKGGGYGWAKIPGEFFELLLRGNERGKTYRFTESNMSGDAWSDVEFALSTGYRLPWKKDILPSLPLEGIAAGLTLKYMVGFYHTGISDADGGIYTDEDTGEIIGWGDIAFEAAAGGGGFGADLGFLTWWQNGLTLSLAFMNVLGSYAWTDDVEIRTYSFADTLSAEDMSKGDKKDDDDDDDKFDIEETIIEGGEFSYRLPAFMRIGCAFPLGPSLLIAGEYLQGFTRGPGITTTPRISAGIEYFALPWLPLMGGLSVGGVDGYVISLGAGLSFSHWRMDLALANQRGIANGANGFNVAFGTGVTF
jgi:hypothetical protein